MVGSVVATGTVVDLSGTDVLDAERTPTAAPTEPTGVVPTTIPIGLLARSPRVGSGLRQRRAELVVLEEQVTCRRRAISVIVELRALYAQFG